MTIVYRVCVAMECPFSLPVEINERCGFLSLKKVLSPLFCFDILLNLAAYAKFHGSYATIVGGFVSKALMDLTGGVPGKM